MTHVKNNSGNNEWYTPKRFIEAARSVMGSIDCDPASNDYAQQWIKAVFYYTIDDSAFEPHNAWVGNVWMNPPYSRGLCKEFVLSLIDQLDDTIEQAITLTNNATETQWFAGLLNNASAVCFMTGRVKFLGQEGNPVGAPLQGQAFCYFGPNVKKFADRFRDFGPVYIPSHQATP